MIIYHDNIIFNIWYLDNIYYRIIYISLNKINSSRFFTFYRKWVRNKRTDNRWLKIDHYCTWNMSTWSGFRKECCKRIITATNAFIRWHLSIRLIYINYFFNLIGNNFILKMPYKKKRKWLEWYFAPFKIQFKF